MADEVNIMIVGVGGQGVILISELLGQAAVNDGLRVRGSEVLGMAVRGGSVSSTIRIGSEVHGPLIPSGRCDILVGMEPSEVLRNISYLSPAGLVIFNTEAAVPFTVALGASEYPSLESIVEKLAGVSDRVVALNATQIAREAGSSLAANSVMLGALFGTGRLPIKMETIKGRIQARFAARLATVNLRAFDLGSQTYRKTVEAEATPLPKSG